MMLVGVRRIYILELCDSTRIIVSYMYLLRHIGRPGNFGTVKIKKI